MNNEELEARELQRELVEHLKTMSPEERKDFVRRARQLFYSTEDNPEDLDNIEEFLQAVMKL